MGWFEDWLEERKKKKVVTEYLYEQSNKEAYDDRADAREKRNNQLIILGIGLAVLGVTGVLLSGATIPLLAKGLIELGIFGFNVVETGRIISTARDIKKLNKDLKKKVKKRHVQAFIAEEPEQVEELMRENSRRRRRGSAAQRNPQPQIQQQPTQPTNAQTQAQPQPAQPANAQTQAQPQPAQPTNAQTQAQPQPTQPTNEQTQVPPQPVYYNPRELMFPEDNIADSYESRGFGPEEYTRMCKNLACRSQNFDPQNTMNVSREGSQSINSAGYHAFTSVNTGPVESQSVNESTGRSR